MKLLGVMIGTNNPKELGEFYTKVFGTPGWHDENWYGFDIQGGNLMVGPHSEVKGQSAEPARIMISMESNDVTDDFKKLKQHGAKVIAEPYNPDPTQETIWLATLADPDGNYIQLSTPWKE